MRMRQRSRRMVRGSPISPTSRVAPKSMYSPFPGQVRGFSSRRSGGNNSDWSPEPLSGTQRAGALADTVKLRTALMAVPDRDRVVISGRRSPRASHALNTFDGAAPEALSGRSLDSMLPVTPARGCYRRLAGRSEVSPMIRNESLVGDTVHFVSMAVSTFRVELRVVLNLAKELAAQRSAMSHCLEAYSAELSLDKLDESSCGQCGAGGGRTTNSPTKLGLR